MTTTRYVLDPAAGLTQVLADGTNTYLYGNDRLAQYQADMQYFGADGLGSVRQIYDASAQMIGSARYDPYGNVMAQSGATSVFAFAGEQHDATGLTYLRARYYSAAQGRFTTRDVWEGDANAPMSYNAWNYTNGNPVNRTDPTGHDLFLIGGLNASSGVEPYDDPGYWETWINEYTGWTHDQYLEKWYDPWMSAKSDLDKMQIAQQNGVGVFDPKDVRGGSQFGDVSETAVKLQKQIDDWRLKDVTVAGHSKGAVVLTQLLHLYETGVVGRGEVKRMVLIDPPQGDLASRVFGSATSPDARAAGVAVATVLGQVACANNPPCPSTIINDFEFCGVNDHSLQSQLAAKVFWTLSIYQDAHARRVPISW